MTTYSYEAMREPGQPVTGEIEADSEHAATLTLLARGYHVLRLDSQDGTRGRVARPYLGGFGGLKRRDLIRITRDSANLLRAGLPLSQVLSTLANRGEDAAWQGVLRGVRVRLEDGQTFSEALAAYPDVFSPMYINLVNAGERSGTLVEVLLRLADASEKQESIRSRVKMAMVYPSVMLTLGILTVFVLVTFVVPMFVDVFRETKQVLPFPTRVIVGLSGFLHAWWQVISIPAVLVVYGVAKYFKTPAGRHLASRIALRLPLLSGVVRKTELASFSQTLGTLLTSGLPIVNALDITAATLSNAAFVDAVRAMVLTVRDGGLLSEAVAKHPLFPQMTASIVGVGERTGELSEALKQLAEEYERDVDRQVKVVMTLIEPLMIVLLGAVVGFIVLAMLLPIFELGDAIQM